MVGFSDCDGCTLNAKWSARINDVDRSGTSKPAGVAESPMRGRPVQRTRMLRGRVAFSPRARLLSNLYIWWRRYGVSAFNRLSAFLCKRKDITIRCYYFHNIRPNVPCFLKLIFFAVVLLNNNYSLVRLKQWNSINTFYCRMSQANQRYVSDFPRVAMYVKVAYGIMLFVQCFVIMVAL